MANDLGETLTGVYSIPGGQAQLFERGLTITSDSGAGQVISFAFPMIGRPSILTGASVPTLPFEPHAINFYLKGWSLATLSALIQSALARRLCLVPTGRTEPQLVLMVGPADVVRPEEPGPGPVVRPALYGSPVARPAGLQDRQLYDVAVLERDRNRASSLRMPSITARPGPTSASPTSPTCTSRVASTGSASCSPRPAGTTRRDACSTGTTASAGS